MMPALDCLRFDGPAADLVARRRVLAEAGLAVPCAEVVRSAWAASLFAERSGGWPLVLRSVPDGGRGVHHVADAREAALVLENGEDEPWIAEQRVAPDAVVTVAVDRHRDGGGSAVRSVERPWSTGGSVDLADHVHDAAVELARRAADAIDADGLVTVTILVRGEQLLVDDVTAVALAHGARRALA